MSDLKDFQQAKRTVFKQRIGVSKRSFFNKLTQVLVGKTRVDDDKA